MKPKKAAQAKGHPVKKIQVDTPVGPHTVEFCDIGIHAISHSGSDSNNLDKDADAVEAKESEHPGVEWVKAYFGTNNDEIKDRDKLLKDPNGYPPICWEGLSAYLSEFALEVLKGALEKVKYGQTVSYGQLAKMIGHEGASRAVGTALKNNPISLLIPCHRVIRADGSSGNYSGGTRNNVKEWLIQHEKNDP